MEETHRPAIPNIAAMPRTRVDQVSVRLVFSAFAPRTLDEIIFRNQAVGREYRCRRGNQPGAFENIGTFRWSNAVRALALLLVRHTLAQRMGEPTFVLAGAPGSIAASLESAIAKPPAWLRAVFGIEQSKSPILRSLFKRKYLGKSRETGVMLSVGFPLHAHNIEIRCGNVLVTDITALTTLAQELEAGVAPTQAAITPAPAQSTTDGDGAIALVSPNAFSSYAVTRTGLRATNSPGPEITVDPALDLNDPTVLASTLDVISETLGDVVSKDLFSLKKDIEVVVLNRQGDAKVIIHSLYANLTNAPILERRETIWSESPIDGVGLRAYSGDQPVPCLPTTFEPHVKEFALQFATPIQPRETRRYRLEYSISGMFKDRQFYFVRIYPGVVHQTFCLRIDPSLALSSVFVTRQSATDRPTASSSTTSAVEFIEKDGEVRWELYSPRAGSIIRTYWSYA